MLLRANANNYTSNTAERPIGIEDSWKRRHRNLGAESAAAAGRLSAGTPA